MKVSVWCSLGIRWEDDRRTPEDDEKLKRLVGLEFVNTPELDVLCSSSYLNYMEEPYEMAKFPTPKHHGGSYSSQSIGGRREVGSIGVGGNGNTRTTKSCFSFGYSLTFVLQ